MSPQFRSCPALIFTLGLVGPTLAAELVLKVENTNTVAMGGNIEFHLETERVWPNPHDPEQVQMDLEITTPSGAKQTVPAFFFQPCEWRLVERGGRKTEWVYPTGQAGWRVRFTPSEPGRHSARASLKEGEQKVFSEPIPFSCLAGPDKGGLRVSPKDPRFLEWSDGTPFFAIGQNVAFVGLSQYMSVAGAGEAFRRMAENGANFVRVWTCCEDWALAIEARKSAWGRSWDWRPSFVPRPVEEPRATNRLCVGLGGTQPKNLAVSPSHPVAVRPSQTYRLGGRIMTETNTTLSFDAQNGPLGGPAASAQPGHWTSVDRTFTTAANQWWLGDLRLRLAGEGRAWVDGLSLCEAAGGPNLLWEAEVNRPLRGVYDQVDSSMLDRLVAAAEQHGIYLQLCLLTRDLYRPALKDPKTAEYRQATLDAQKLLRYAVARWGWSRHVGAWEYFNEMDPNAPTVSFYGALGDDLERTDPYHHLRTTSAWGPAPNDWKQPRMDMAQLHWYLRPAWGQLSRDEVAAVLDRTRLLRMAAPDKPALLAEFGLADDKWGLSPYMRQDKDGVHFHNALWASSFCGLSGTAMFWWWETLDQQDLYRHYKPLAAFLAGIPFTTGQFQAVSSESEKQSRVLAWRGRDGFYGWISNPEATWWKQVVEKKPLAEIQGDTLTVEVSPGGTYRVEWWDTNTGAILKQTEATLTAERLRLPIPPYAGDIACKVVRKKANQ
jgi:hypothetical protein